MSNFESISINDAGGTARRVAGDFVNDGVNDLFHQTARNLNTVLEEQTGVTLSSTTPTDIALNGMESHVIVDAGGLLTNELFVQLQHTAGGQFYAAHYDRLMPLSGASSIRDSGADWQLEDGKLSSGRVATGGGQSGAQLFLIPTCGATTLRLQLYGSSVTLAGVAWKRVVLGSSPVQPVISRELRSMTTKSLFISSSSQPYADGQFIGSEYDLEGPNIVNGIHPSFVRIKNITMRNEFVMPDFDLIFASSLTHSDGEVWNGNNADRIFTVLEFRHAPGQGQHRIWTGGAAGGSAASVVNLDLVMAQGYTDYDADREVGTVSILARGAHTLNNAWRGLILFDI